MISWLRELVISFLPYLIIFALMGMIISFVMWKKRGRKRSVGYWPLLFLLSALVFFLCSQKFTGFYRFPVQQIDESMTGGVKILYANIYKDNDDYTGIQDLITQEQPDLIFFVEFAQHHYEALKPLLKKEYPYTNSTIWSNKFVGNVVFSKIKIENWADDFSQGAWRYGYFSVRYDSSPLYFYLVHMSSPSSEVNFLMRNRQIETFLQDFLMHKDIHRAKHDKVVALGDFNTTPRSRYYWLFAQSFEGEFVNITRSFSLLFTWKLVPLPLFWAHIDHIFVNKEVRIRDLHLVTVPGSDHRGFSFLVK